MPRPSCQSIEIDLNDINFVEKKRGFFSGTINIYTPEKTSITKISKDIIEPFYSQLEKAVDNKNQEG